MINFTRFIGPYGIPIYHQQLPDIVQAVSIGWIIFTGSADDHLVGAEGAYHWFEHVPFRGTKNFPGGYAAIQDPFTPFCGKIGARTGRDCTIFSGEVFRGQWKQGLETTTDLWSQPLLADESINAEREIIFEEIRQQKAAAVSKAYYQLSGMLYPNHPYGHHGLGSEESLNSISPETLRHAHEIGYDRSRAALVICGNISSDEVQEYLSIIVERTPSRGLSERRRVPSHGTLPEWQFGKETIVDTEFDTSVIFTLFPVPALESIRETLLWALIRNLLAGGGLASPLYRILREERKLVYSTRITATVYPDGGYWGFQSLTGNAKVDAARDAIWDVLKDDQLYSQKLFEDIKSGMRFSSKMRSVDAGDFGDIAVNSLRSHGEVLSDDEADAIHASFTRDEVYAAFDQFTPDRARTIVFEGKS